MNGFQTFDIREGESQLGAAGNFIRYDSTSGKPIKIRGDGQDLGKLWPDESLELGQGVSTWTISAEPGEEGIVRIGFGRIESTRQVHVLRPPVLVMEAGTAPVTAGGPEPGWVSGTFVNLAPSTSADVVFDLGPDWQQYALIEVTVGPHGPSSGLNPVQVFGSSTTAPQNSRRRGPAFATALGAFYVNMPSSSGAQSMTIRQMGRFVIVRGTNADATNAQGPASTVTLAAFPS